MHISWALLYIDVCDSDDKAPLDIELLAKSFGSFITVPSVTTSVGSKLDIEFVQKFFVSRSYFGVHYCIEWCFKVLIKPCLRKIKVVQFSCYIISLMTKRITEYNYILRNKNINILLSMHAMDIKRKDPD